MTLTAWLDAEPPVMVMVALPQIGTLPAHGTGVGFWPPVSPFPHGPVVIALTLPRGKETPAAANFTGLCALAPLGHSSTSPAMVAARIGNRTTARARLARRRLGGRSPRRVRSAGSMSAPRSCE